MLLSIYKLLRMEFFEKKNSGQNVYLFIIHFETLRQNKLGQERTPSWLLGWVSSPSQICRQPE